MHKRSVVLAIVAVFANVAHSQAPLWTIQGNTLIETARLNSLLNRVEPMPDGRLDVAAIRGVIRGAYYRAAGLKVEIDVSNDHVVTIREPKILAAGAWKGGAAWKQLVASTDFSAAVRMVGHAAEEQFQREQVNCRHREVRYIQNPAIRNEMWAALSNTDTASNDTNYCYGTKPEDGSPETHGVRLAIDNSGNRYTGEEMLRLQAYQVIGDGRAYVNAAKTISGLHNDSNGGDFKSLNAGYRFINPLGASDIGVLSMDYTTGKAIGNYKGELQRLYANHEVVLAKDVRATIGFDETRDQKSQGNLGNTFEYGTLRAGIKAKLHMGDEETDVLYLAGGLNQGVHGNYNAKSAGAVESKPSSTFTMAEASATLVGSAQVGLPKALNYTVAAGGFVGSKDAPLSEQGVIGGAGRGRSQQAGVAVGNQGGYASAEVSYPITSGDNCLFALAGVEAAVAKQANGGTRHVESAYIGARQRVSDHVSLEATIAKNIGADAVTKQNDDVRINFNFVMEF